MAKERLSRLQLRILGEIYENRYITKDSLKSYYGKQLNDNWSNSERVTIHKSLHNLVSKRLIFNAINDRYYLTELGFELLKANASLNNQVDVNFKVYKQLVDAEIEFFNKQLSLTDRVIFMTKMADEWERLVGHKN